MERFARRIDCLLNRLNPIIKQEVWHFYKLKSSGFSTWEFSYRLQAGWPYG